MKPESRTFLRNLQTVTRSAIADSGALELRSPGLTILAHPDLQRVGERAVLTALGSGQLVLLSRLDPMFAAPGDRRRRPLADPHLSRHPLKLVPTGNGALRLVRKDTQIEVEAQGVPVDESRDFSPAEVERGVVLLLAKRIVLLLHLLDPLPPRDVPRFGMIGESAGIIAVRQQISRVADLSVPALLRGETGTGKELTAKAIHRASARRDGPFVAINMGALPPTLAAAELFGVAEGAITGTDRLRSGHIGRAQGGTLFLDEIAEALPEVQLLLLRILETGNVQQVGSETSRAADVRVLAATDAALEAEIEAGRFRASLYHRLSGYEIRLPPLRERKDDLGRLLLHFLREEIEAAGETWPGDAPAAAAPRLPAPVVARLAAYSWPGNVRQLRNVARHLVVDNRDAPQLLITPQIEALLEIEPDAVRTSAATAGGASASLGASLGGATGQSVSKTLLLTDLVDSTRLVESLGDQRAVTVMSIHDREARELLTEYDGHEIDKSDGFLFLFERPADALCYALEYHERLAELSEELGVELAARAGIHLGEVYVRRNTAAEVARGAKSLEIEGLAKPMAARLMSLAGARQTLLTRSAFDLAGQAAQGDHPLAGPDVRWLRHGLYSFQGLQEPVEVLEVGVEGAAPLVAPADVPKAKRYRASVAAHDEAP